MRDDSTYEGWIAVFKANTDYEADLVRDRLDDAGIPAVVFTQRDHAFNLNLGDLAPVNVMVRPEQADQARALLDSPPMSDEELDAAAMAADPTEQPAHDSRREAMLDSGMESIDLSIPEEDEDRLE